MKAQWVRGSLERLVNDESGQTVMEYSLMVVLVALAIAAAFPPVQAAIVTVFTNVQAALGG